MVLTSDLNGTIKRDVLPVDRRSFTHKARTVKIDETGDFYMIPGKHGTIRAKVSAVRSIVFFKGPSKKHTAKKQGVLY